MVNIINISHFQADIYMFKVDSRKTRARCEISSKLRRTGVFFVKFEHNPHPVALLFLLMTFNRQMPVATYTCI